MFGATIAFLLVAGFGCGRAPAVDEPSGTPDAARVEIVPPAEVRPQETIVPAAEGAMTLETTVQLDDTWKTYTNAALGFSFRWPSKGRYAPDWEVRFFGENSDKMQDGCFDEGAVERNPSAQVTVGGVGFCHSSFEEGAAGSRYLVDHYATKKGSQYVVISFTKRTTSAAALGCTGFELSASPAACVEFDEKAYLELLNQIVSTFAYR
jgi:hypothetical protein